MRDQYAGDISDLLKFAFLRTLAGDDTEHDRRPVAVAWYYNPVHDGRPDGRHREYCLEPKWENLDKNLWRALRELPEQSVAALEALSIWPAGTRFHRVPVPRAATREEWARGLVLALRDASIVFLDPDNGVGKESERHATFAEVAAIRRPGRTVALIKFPGRAASHAEQIEEYHASLKREAGALSVITVRTSVFVSSGSKQGTPRVRWFTLIDADEALIERARQFAAGLNALEKCRAQVVEQQELIQVEVERPCDAVLRLMGLLERVLMALTPDGSPFHRQADKHRSKFSDFAGISEARRVRNDIAHGERVSEARAREAQAILKQALTEIAKHCPERLQTAIRDASGTSTPASPQARPQPGLPRNLPELKEPESDIAHYDWVYFATPSQEDWATTEATVRELELIIRPVYDRRIPPNSIANVRNLRVGQTILLVYGGKGKPYRAMCVCTIVPPTRPVPQFKAMSFADPSQDDRLRSSGFAADPHLNRFTGISVTLSQFRPTGSFQRPAGNNTIRSWSEVQDCNAPIG